MDLDSLREALDSVEKQGEIIMNINAILTLAKTLIVLTPIKPFAATSNKAENSIN